MKAQAMPRYREMERKYGNVNLVKKTINGREYQYAVSYDRATKTQVYRSLGRIFEGQLAEDIVTVQLTDDDRADFAELRVWLRARRRAHQAAVGLDVVERISRRIAVAVAPAPPHET